MTRTCAGFNVRLAAPILAGNRKVVAVGGEEGEKEKKKIATTGSLANPRHKFTTVGRAGGPALTNETTNFLCDCCRCDGIAVYRPIACGNNDLALQRRNTRLRE